MRFDTCIHDVDDEGSDLTRPGLAVDFVCCCSLM